jgi:hypothetical protein
MKATDELNANELNVLMYVCKSIDDKLPLPKDMSILKQLIADKKKEITLIHKNTVEYYEFLERMIINIEKEQYR